MLSTLSLVSSRKRGGDDLSCVMTELRKVLACIPCSKVQFAFWNGWIPRFIVWKPKQHAEAIVLNYCRISDVDAKVISGIQVGGG